MLFWALLTLATVIDSSIINKNEKVEGEITKSEVQLFTVSSFIDWQLYLFSFSISSYGFVSSSHSSQETAVYQAVAKVCLSCNEKTKEQ